MKIQLSGRLLALFAAAATLATATLIDASSSSQVEQLGLLAVPRTGHAATALADGRVLITGGRDNAGIIVATAEVFDPAKETSTAIGALNTARIDHTATLLADGRVLIAGGTSVSGAVTSVEIFDPANPGAGFRVLSATMGAARAGHTATRLHNGTVLIAGGDAAGTAEIFNPTTETFSSALLAMAAPRIGHTATLFSDDSVLLAGGNTDSMEYFSSIDQTFTLDQAKLTATRTGQDAISLSDTHLLFFGGDIGHTIDEFNTSADTLTLKATMDGASSSATLLANGKILILRPDAAGLYDPDATDQATAFTVFDETSVPSSTALLRSGQTATELSGDKKILVAGGVNAQHQPTLQIAAFNPARIWTDKDDYQPGDNVILSGSGWKPNENVYLYAVDDTTEAWTYGSTAIADANGGFVVNPFFIVQLVQLGANFSVSAVGAQSAMQADVKFTDSKPNTLTVGPPNSVSVTPGGTANYTISVTFNGNGNSCTSPLSITSGLPPGVGGSDVVFTPSSVTSTGTTQTASLAIATHAGTVPGSYTFTVLADGTGCSQSGTATGTGVLVVAGSATHFSVAGFPSPVTAGTPGTFTVTALDSNNNIAFGYTGTATFSSSDAQATFAPASYTFLAADKGVHTFSNGATLKTAGTQSITATQGAITGTQSGIVVNASAATKLALGGSTADLASGSTRVLTATIQDANGNTVTSGPNSTLNVTFAKTGGTGTVTGLGSTNAVAGVATLTVTGNAVGPVTITASATGLAPGTGNPISFNVVAAAASRLVITGSATQTAGTTQNLTITAKDGSGNIDTNYTGDKTLTFSGANASTSPVTSPTVTSKTGTAVNFGTATTITFSNGVATVSGSSNGVMTLFKVETATIAVTDGAISAGGVDRLTVTVSAGTLAKFALSLTSPQTNGSAFTGANTLTAQDSWGNTVTNFNAATDNVTVLANAPLTGTVSGLGSGANNILNQADNFSSGVANLTTLGMNYTGNATTGTFTATSVSGKTGTSGNVTINASTTVDHFKVEAAAGGNIGTQTAGTAFNIKITAQDASDNTVTSFDGNGNKVNLTSTGTLVFTNPSAAFTNGVLTASVTITNTGTNFTITATGTGGNSGITGTSNSFQVNPGAASKLAFSQQPTTTTAGQTITPAVTVQIQDANGNLTNSSASVALAIGTNPSAGTLSGTTPVTAVNGVATFNDLSINKGGTGYTLQASSAGVTSTTSSAFTINNPAPTLTSINPTSGNLSQTLNVDFNGSGYIQGVSSVSFADANITVNTVTVTSSIKLTAHITIGAGATIGQHNVSVTNAAPVAGTATATLINAFTVNNPATTTTVTSSENPSTYGDSVTFTATVSSASASPTGSVNFVIDGGAAVAGIPGATTATTATWTYTTSALTVSGSPHSVSASFTHTGAFADSSGLLTGGQTVNKATPTATLSVTNSSQTYTGSGLAAVVNVSTSSVPGTTANVLTGGAATQTNAGTYAVTADFVPNDTNNYNTLTGLSAGNFVIDKATPTATLKVTNSPVTYNGNAHAANVAVDTSSVPGTTANVLTGGAATQTNAGTYAVTADFVPNDSSNYKTLTGLSAGNFVIDKATPTATLAVNNSPQTYNGNGQAATVNITASSTPGHVANILTGGAANQTNAGTYAVTADFVPTDSNNYNTLTALSAGNFVISKANATVAVTPYTSATTIYDGHAHTAAVTSITGVNGETGAVVGTVDVSHTAHTNAGTYASDYWFFTGTANYNNIGNTTIIDSIGKADAAVVVTAYTSATTTYDGHPHTATVTSITGVNGETGNTVGTVDVSHTTNTNAGTYAADYWFFTGTANYNDIGNTTITDSIGQADATVVVTPYTTADTTYDGHEHTATYTITGVNGESGATVGTTDVTHTAHTNAGTFTTDYWTFTGAANYKDIAATTITDSIAKANATVVVTPYTSATTTYDGNPHTAAVTSITGVNGETGNPVGTVDVSHTTHIAAGTYSTDYWTFTGTANYNDIAATRITDSIDKATATVVVTPYTSATTTYDGHPHTATVTSIMGVNGETGAMVGTVDVSHTTNTNAGTYPTDYWTFTGAANYKDITATTITDSIAKANATAVVTPYTTLTTIYDGNPHSATVTSITGVNGETGAIVGTVDVSHTIHTNAGTYSTDYWTFAGGINYNNIGATTITDSIAKANAAVLVAAYTGATTTYDANPHTATVTSITGVHGETGGTVGTVDVSHTTHTDAGTYSTDYWTFTGTANYNDIGAQTITDSIAKAIQTITWANPANVVVGTLLSATQLNATVAGVAGGTPPGALTYTPPAGTVLPAGANQALKVDAAATINYNANSKTVYINVNYTFVGFLQPIDNLPIINSVKAGQTIPVKWQLKDAAGYLIGDLGSLAASGLQSVKIACDNGAPIDAVEELAAPGSTVFRFDGTQFIFNWQTTKSWAGTCRMMTVTLKDGNVYSAQFTFK